MKKNYLRKIILHTLKDEQECENDTSPHIPKTAWSDNIQQYRFRSLNVDRLPTHVSLRAINSYLSLPKSGVEDSLDVSDCATLILPVVPMDLVSNMPTTLLQPAVSEIEGQASILSKLVKSSGIYALASTIPPLVSLGLSPFLTRHLSPSDYGALTLLNSFISLAAGVTQLGLGSAFFRAYSYDYTSEDDRRAVLSTANTLLCLVSIITVVGVTLLAPSLANLLLGRSSYRNLIVLAAGVVLLQNLAVPAFAWLRAESRPLFYSLLAIANILILLIANIVLVGVFSLGIVGSLIATGSGYVCVTLCMIPLVFIRAGIKLRFDIARSMLAYGVPLIFNVISYWALQVLDRYLLSLLGSLSQTAEYAVAYTLGSALSVIVISPFGLAWPTVLFSIAKRKDAAQIFQHLFRWFSMFLLFAAFGLSLAATILLKWLFPVVYHSAAPIIPVVSVSLAFYGAYYVFVTGINIKRKTWLIGVFSTIAALINLALNLVLIPRYGAMGAATSTLLAYIALAIVAYIVNQSIYPISFEIGKFIVAILLGIALYLGSSFLTQSQPAIVAWGISFSALGIYGGCLTALGLLPSLMRKYKTRRTEEIFVS
jgi:O-antigen/teichoic acid export membrane protein